MGRTDMVPGILAGYPSHTPVLDVTAFRVFLFGDSEQAFALADDGARSFHQRFHVGDQLRRRRLHFGVLVYGLVRGHAALYAECVRCRTYLCRCSDYSLAIPASCQRCPALTPVPRSTG